MKLFFQILAILFIVDGLLYVLVPEWKKQVIQRFFMNVSPSVIRVYGVVIIVLAVLFLIFLSGGLNSSSY